MGQIYVNFKGTSLALAAVAGKANADLSNVSPSVGLAALGGAAVDLSNVVSATARTSLHLSRLLIPDDYKLSSDADDNASLNRMIAAAATYFANHSEGSTCFFPDRVYLNSGTIDINTDFLNLVGMSRENVRIRRTTDFGAHFVFQGSNGANNYRSCGAVSSMTFDDYGVGTPANSPFSVIWNWVNYPQLKNIRNVGVPSGFAFMDCSGVDIDQIVAQYAVPLSIPTGSLSAYRSGNAAFLFDQTTLTGASPVRGGDIFMRNVNIYGDFGVGRPGVDYGIINRSTDGIWLSNSHVIYCAKAAWWVDTNERAVYNVYPNNVLLDISYGDGLLLTGSNEIDDLMGGLMISSQGGTPPATALAVRKTCITRNMDLRVNLRGFEGGGVSLLGGGSDNRLDLSGSHQNTGGGSAYSLTIQDEVRLTTSVSAGGDGAFIGGVHILADTAASTGLTTSVSIVGERLGDFAAPGYAVTIDSGYGGKFYMEGVDCSASSGLLNNSTTATVQIDACPGLSPLKFSHTVNSADWNSTTIPAGGRISAAVGFTGITSKDFIEVTPGITAGGNTITAHTQIGASGYFEVLLHGDGSDTTAPATLSLNFRITKGF